MKSDSQEYLISWISSIANSNSDTFESGVISEAVKCEKIARALQAENTEAYDEASRLFKILAPQCDLAPTTSGVITQIDNYIAGQDRKRNALQAENDRLNQNREEIRRAVAELLETDSDNWPFHGNVELAITASFSLALHERDAAQANEARLRKLLDQEHFSCDGNEDCEVCQALGGECKCLPLPEPINDNCPVHGGE